MLGSYTQIMILYNQKLEQEMERNRYAREPRKPRKERVPALSRRAGQCACTPAPTRGVQNVQNA